MQAVMPAGSAGMALTYTNLDIVGIICMERKEYPCPQCGRIKYYDGLCWVCKAQNERQQIADMSQEELQSRINALLEKIKTADDLDDDFEDQFSKLARYRNIDTSEFARIAFNNGIYFPCGLYKDAPEQIVKGLCELLMRDDLDSFLANQILLCAAVAGARPQMRQTVYDTFVTLHKEPRAWRSKLHVDPCSYAPYGGWTYDKDFNMMEVVYPQCWSLVKGTAQDKANSPVNIISETAPEGHCSRCGARLFEIIRIDGRDPRLAFLKIDGVLSIKGCMSCLYWDDGYFTGYDLQGNSWPLTEYEQDPNCECTISEDDYQKMAANTWVLGPESASLRWHADWDMGSSIGGYAFWVQDVDIKTCPKCGKPMKYLAQIQWDTVEEFAEGYGYIEICPDCQVACVIHQQT